MAYGYGTKSHLNSTEFRQAKKECATFTEKYLAGEIRIQFSTPPLMCRCPQRPYPHELSVHGTIGSDWASWGMGQNRNSWPWSLRFIGA